MVSWFRRNKPESAAPRRLSTEDLAAAFPDAPAPAGDEVAPTTPPAPVVDTLPAPAEPTPPTSDPVPEAPPAPAGKPGWRERLRGSAFARSFGGLFSRNPRLDDDLLDEIETALLTADVGVTASTQLVESLRKRMKAAP